MYIDERFPKITDLVKKIIYFFIIVTLFSSLPILYAQETLEPSIELAEVSFEFAAYKAEPIVESSTPLFTETTHESNHIECCPVFVYSIFGIITLIIVAMVSFRIRRNTLKLF